MHRGNTYLNVLPIAENSEGARSAVLSLSATYMKDYIVSEATQYENADHVYMVQAVQSLITGLGLDESPETYLITGMLLTQHSTVNDRESDPCWSCHVDMIDVLQQQNRFSNDSEPAISMVYQYILAMTAQSLTQIFTRKPKRIEWIVECADSESERICGTLGLSRQLLYLIGSITDVATSIFGAEKKVEQAKAIEVQLGELDQWTEDATGDALDVVIRTSTAYRFAAKIYLKCRVLG